MLLHPTTFIVGAGASLSSGLSSGNGLVRAALQLQSSRQWTGKRTQEHERRILTVDALLRPMVTDSVLNSFLDDLREHGYDTIDQFLRAQPQYHTPEGRLARLHDDVGRKFIAAYLGDQIRMGGGNTLRDDDWLTHALTKMLRGANTPSEFVEKNMNVRFITFNFDSVIENGIARFLRARYKNHPANDIKLAINSIRVLHVHGCFTPPAPNEPLSSNWVIENAQRIHVVGDQIEHGILAQVESAIRDAVDVFFLGFAYDEGNLKTLGLPHPIQSTASHVYGTAVGLDGGDRRRVTRLFGTLCKTASQVIVGEERMTCFPFLQAHL